MTDFDTFWSAYPRKVSKKPAQKAWDKLKDSEQRAAIADVEKRNRANAWSSDRTKIPHATTYLNQARYEDEWEPDLRASGNGTRAGPVSYVPRETLQLPPLLAAACRLFLPYCRSAFGRCNVKAMLAERDRLIRETGEYLMADIESGDKELRREAFDTFRRELLKRWDRINA